MRILILTIVLTLTVTFCIAGCGKDTVKDMGSKVESAVDSVIDKTESILIGAESKLMDGTDSSYNSYSSNSSANNGNITSEKAKSIVLNHAKVDEKDIYDLDIELDNDGGTTHYDIDFETKTAEYDYDVDAKTGKIISSDKKEKSTTTGN